MCIYDPPNSKILANVEKQYRKIWVFYIRKKHSRLFSSLQSQRNANVQVRRELVMRTS